MHTSLRISSTISQRREGCEVRGVKRLTWLVVGLFILVLVLALSGSEWGGVLLIGPIPIVLASSPSMSVLTIGMAMGLMVLSILFMYLSRAWMFQPQETTEEQEKEHTERRVEGGAVIMIGPFPVVIGSNTRWAALLMVLALALMALWLIALVLR